MANIFGFQMSEDFLSGYAAYLKSLREQNPEKSYVVTLSVDLIPDGIGYEIRDRPQITIEEVGAKQSNPLAQADEEFEQSLDVPSSLYLIGTDGDHYAASGMEVLTEPVEPE